MTWHSTELALANEAETAQLAGSIAQTLRPSDTLLLSGSIGAGKSAFARAVIRYLVGPETDVPSPTFTLVQMYDFGATEIWHCDLYRMTNADELVELGLDDAFEQAICLIEWPDRLGDLTPPDALHMQFQAQADHHIISASGSQRWKNRLGEFFVKT